MSDAMSARGPDGSGLWISPDRSVGLAHRRLSLIDLTDAGSQPMANLDGSLRIVFNGEIYNHIELRHELELDGFHFRSQSDTEVLLHLYAKVGAAMVHRLRGMYALAIWDERNQQLFAARDPLGIKPLYYSDDGRTLRIASQVKALLNGGALNVARDPAGQAGFLLFGYVPEPFTTYRAISCLPAGACIVAARDSQPEIRRLCRVEDELAAAESDNGKLPTFEIREHLRGVISDSVRRHLIADVPVGVFLSAGLDSTLITAIASEAPGARLRTITLGFDEYQDTENDETTLARTVAERYGTDHLTRWVSRTEFEDDLERVIAAMDQPSIDGVNTYFVSKAAHNLGLKAALSGVGGDELFGGYPSFAQVPRIARWSFPHVLGKAARVASSSTLARLGYGKHAGFLEYAGRWGGAYLLRRALFMPWEIEKLLPREVAQPGLEALKSEAALEKTLNGIGSQWLKVTALEMVWYMRNQLLRDSDWAGMAHSVEIRTPLVDLEVMRAVASLIACDVLAPHKRDIAMLPAKPMPHALLARRKTGFAVPVRDWIANQDNPKACRGLRGWAMRLAREFDFAA
jgi:asparagine synthase (glutamine-hydrolysing)